MALTKGARKLFEWLQEQNAGAIVSYDDVMDAAGWIEKSLTTYLSKNKVAPFLQRVAGRKLKVLMDGSEISESFFHEVFTQTAPRRLTLSTGDRLQGASGVHELTEPLGNGAIGHVWAAKTGNDLSQVAAKVMLPRGDLLRDSKLPNVRERFRREAKNGLTLNHPNVVSYLDMGSAEGNPFLIMELANRSVADQIKQTGPIPEEEAAEIVEYCIAGLEFLHGKKCVHRDVKPANILEFSDTVKLGDLGIVKWSDFDPAFTQGGTITRQSVQLGSWFYMAPEQQESPHDAVQASDLYALGVTWIEMLNGILPSPQAIGAGAYKLPGLRTGVADVIARLVSYAPDDRPQLGDVLKVIREAYDR